MFTFQLSVVAGRVPKIGLTTKLGNKFAFNDTNLIGLTELD